MTASRAIVALALAGAAAGGCGGDLGADDPADGVDQAARPIISGSYDTGKDPAVGFLLGRGSGYRVFCSSTMITSRVILTAAHCVNDSSETHEVWFADSYDASTGQFTGLIDSEKRTVVKTWFHPSFDESALNHGFDIGLLLLDKPIPASMKALPWLRRRPSASTIGQTARMVGFGHRIYDTADPLFIKLWAKNQVARVTSNTFELDGPTQITCQGDSGGPLFLTVDGVESIAGITSYGDTGCHDYAVFTRVDLYLDDIRKFVAENDPQPPSNCAADGVCGSFCSAPDPDCPCAGDGFCPASCTDPESDPDCPLGCGKGGGCVREGCPGKDPDCGDLPAGAACTSDDACASGICHGSSRICVTRCGAGNSCQSSFSCDTATQLCLPVGSGCGCAAGAPRGERDAPATWGGWLALLAAIGLARVRRHRAG